MIEIDSVGFEISLFRLMQLGTPGSSFSLSVTVSREGQHNILHLQSTVNLAYPTLLNFILT